MYMMMKHMHLTLVAISLLFFITRYFWVMTDSGMMQKKWVKIAPHIVDTFLLISAIALCVILAQYPGQVNWLTAKVVGLILYIFFGLVTLKIAKDKKIRSVAFVCAIVTILFMAKLAFMKHALIP